MNRAPCDLGVPYNPVNHGQAKTVRPCGEFFGPIYYDK